MSEFIYVCPLCGERGPWEEREDHECGGIPLEDYENFSSSGVHQEMVRGEGQMSAYATALLESDKKFVVEEALKNHDAAEKLRKKVKRLDADLLIAAQTCTQVAAERDKLKAERDDLAAKLEKVREWADRGVTMFWADRSRELRTILDGEGGDQ